jgi:tryptophan-rich sensory protein
VTARRRRLLPILAGAAAALAVAVVGALVTELGPWYYGLRQPEWKPPDWLFGPAWTFIFACAALAGILAWLRAPDRAARRRVVWLFAINAGLNVLWSVLFFRLQRPDWALAEVVLLWLSIVVLIWVPASYSRAASWLLVPYLAWVTFAALLNFAVVRLNGPFA